MHPQTLYMLCQRLQHKGSVTCQDLTELHEPSESAAAGDLVKYMGYCLETCQEILQEAPVNPIRISTGSS